MTKRRPLTRPKQAAPIDAFKAAAKELRKSIAEMATAAHQWAARPDTSFGDARKMQALALKADDLAAEIARL